MSGLDGQDYSPNMTTRTCEQEQSTLFGRGAQIYIKLYSPCWPTYASTRKLKGTLAGQLIPHKSKKSRFGTLAGHEFLTKKKNPDFGLWQGYNSSQKSKFQILDSGRAVIPPTNKNPDFCILAGLSFFIVIYTYI